MHRSGIFTLLLFSAIACSDSGPSGVEDEPTGSPPQQRLEAAQTWMYQIQELNDPQALAALAATNYPLLVIEPGQNFTDSPYDMANIISTLRTAPDGTERLLLAYVDIGQAEDYRDYWESSWVAPTDSEAGDPEFLLTLDPDGWSGNYVVAYWDTRWKNMWTGPNGIVADLARAGFDGIYMDWVEAYDDAARRWITVEATPGMRLQKQRNKRRGSGGAARTQDDNRKTELKVAPIETQDAYRRFQHFVGSILRIRFLLFAAALVAIFVCIRRFGATASNETLWLKQVENLQRRRHRLVRRRGETLPPIRTNRTG